MKKQLKEIPLTTVKVTVYALRWIFLIIFLYIVGSMILFAINQRYEFLQQIIAWSVGGFFGFFMGYFGWLFAQHIVEWLTKTHNNVIKREKEK
jgi:ABC-type enterochelin transport system permease subunit